MSDTVNSGGVGFGGLLTIAFIVMKLTGYIAWSWWWVLSPLWISAGLGMLIVLVMIVVAALSGK